MRGIWLAGGAAVALGLTAVWLSTAPVARAQAGIACGGFYEVQPGDTLRDIALQAYGVGNYQLIFNANRAILARPSLLLVGQRLFIPCLDGSGPRTRQEAEAAPEEGGQASAGTGTEGADAPEADDPARSGETAPDRAAPAPEDSAEPDLAGEPQAPVEGADAGSTGPAGDAPGDADTAAAPAPAPGGTGDGEGAAPSASAGEGTGLARGNAASGQPVPSPEDPARDNAARADRGGAAPAPSIPLEDGARTRRRTEPVPVPSAAGPAPGAGADESREAEPRRAARSAGSDGGRRPAATGGGGPAFQPMTTGPRPPQTTEILPTPPREAPDGQASNPPPPAEAETAGAAPATGGAGSAIQPAPGTGAPSAAAGIQPSEGSRGGVQPAPGERDAGAIAGLQPAPGSGTVGAGDAGGRDGAAAAGLQPPADRRAEGNAGVQPPITGGGVQPAPGRGGDGADASATATAGGAQPAPAAREATGQPAVGAQPAAEPRARTGQTAGGAQPAPSEAGRARAEAAGIQPAPAAGTATRSDGAAATGDGAGPVATAGGAQPGPRPGASVGGGAPQPGTGSGDAAATARSGTGDAGPSTGGGNTGAAGQAPASRTETAGQAADPDGARAPSLPDDDGTGALAALGPAPANARRDNGAATEPAPGGGEDGDAAPGTATGAAPPGEAGGAAPRRRSVFGLPDDSGPVRARMPQDIRPEPGGVQPLPRTLPTVADSPASAQPGPETRIARTEPEAEAPEAGAPRIRVLSAAMPPYSGEDLPQMGMLPEMVVRALGHAAPGRGVRFSFVGDRGLHLTVLLPDGAYDVGLPWLKPDCDRPGALSAQLRARCTDFLWSQPLQEVVIGYFALAGSPLLESGSHAALSGLTLCRPEGQPRFDLDQNGLGPDAATLLRAPDTGACIDRLLAGEVDVVSVSVGLAQAALAEGGLFDRVAEIPALADIQTLHALSARGNPRGRAALALINRGLATMRDSGEWFRVIARHLSGEAGAATQ